MRTSRLISDSLKAVTLAILMAAGAFAQTPGDVSPLNATVPSLANQVLTFSATYPFDTDNGSTSPTDGSPEMDISIGSSGCSFALQWSSGGNPNYSASDSTNCRVSLANWAW